MKEESEWDATVLNAICPTDKSDSPPEMTDRHGEEDLRTGFSYRSRAGVARLHADLNGVIVEQFASADDENLFGNRDSMFLFDGVLQFFHAEIKPR